MLANAARGGVDGRTLRTTLTPQHRARISAGMRRAMAKKREGQGAGGGTR